LSEKILPQVYQRSERKAKYPPYQQRFREMGVANKKERRKNEEEAGIGAVLEGMNGSQEV
jgi:hypothetical protein